MLFQRGEFLIKVRDFSINFVKKSSYNIKLKIQNLEKKIDEIENIQDSRTIG